jgi:serine/threonine-protein phosphatase 4 catalytic subunit
MSFAEKIMETLEMELLPLEKDIKFLIAKAKEKLIEDPNVIILQPPITIVGDIHGQFFDLLEIFNLTGRCPETNFVFLGDYVDRGYHSVEVILYLLALKVRYPTKVTLLRGNHESRTMTEFYGFYDECMKKFGSGMMYHLFTGVFDLLPISAVVGDRLYLVHGGLSPNIQNISDINSLDRKKEISNSGDIANLCWSDPDESLKTDWEVSPRGSGLLFGAEPVKKFIHTNSLDRIIRAHQLCQEGYTQLFENTLITIFSAPNYCYRCGNFGAVVEVDENNNSNISQYSHVENQYGDLGELNLSLPSYFL